MAPCNLQARGLQRIRRVLGSFRRGIRRKVNLALQPRRRMRSLARIREWPVPDRILVLCLGNICRSPYVEAYLKDRGKDLGLAVTSRGFIGPGRPPPPEALEAAARRGIETEGHVSSLVDLESVKRADLVLLVDPAHGPRLRREFGFFPPRVLVLGDLDPDPVDSRTIPDPWGKGPEVFDRTFERIDRCLDVLLEEWRAREGG